MVSQPCTDGSRRGEGQVRGHEDVGRQDCLPEPKLGVAVAVVVVLPGGMEQPAKDLQVFQGGRGPAGAFRHGVDEEVRDCGVALWSDGGRGVHVHDGSLGCEVAWLQAGRVVGLRLEERGFGVGERGAAALLGAGGSGFGQKG